jgi:hypothetical protein
MKKAIASGVPHKTTKAPMVDPKGAFTKVQERTIGTKKGACANCGKKAKNKK